VEWLKRFLQKNKTRESAVQLRARYGQLPSKELRHIVETVDSSSIAYEVARNLLQERETRQVSGAMTRNRGRDFRKDVRRRLREKDARESIERENLLAVKESERRTKKTEDLRKSLAEILRSETDALSKKQAVNRILSTELSDYSRRGSIHTCECGYPTGVTWRDGSYGPIYELTDCREEYGSFSYYCPNCGKYAGSESV
jgi:hypothetical protein